MSVQSGESITVLLADPDEEAQDHVASGVDGAGEEIVVDPVTTGSAAVESFEAGEYDCLVTEAALPDMGGLELVERVRSASPSVPVIVCTDSGSEQVASEAFSAGATEYFPKEGSYVERLREAIVEGVAARETRRSLEEREERYRTLVERSHDGIYIYRGDEFVFINDRVCEVTGYSRAELYDMNIWELFHPEDRERVREYGARRMQGEDAPTTYSARIRTKDDEVRYLEFSVQTVTYEGEWAALGSVRDVTERREREQELAAEQGFIETILDTLEDVIFVCSLDGEILRWNDRLCEVTGYSDEQISEMTVFDLVPEEYEDDIVEAIRNVESTGMGVVEGEALGGDGERVPFEFRGSPLYNEDGDVVAVAGVARDVSEQRAREQELAQYRTIVEAVGDPVYTIDSDGYFTLVNEALADMTGHTGDELVGEHVSKVMRDQDVDTAERLIEKLIKSDKRQNATFEMEAVTTDGEHIPCEDHIALLPSGDGFSGTAGVVRDITDRKQREKRLRRQNERLDQFAGVVSHDLRNPLNVIMGRLEIARQTGDLEHLDSMAQAGRRMERLIDDLLTLARDGQTVGDVQPVSLETAVRRAWGNVETGEATLTLADEGTEILADRARLASLFENLFRNAVEHGSTDSRTQSGDNRPQADDAVEHGAVSETQDTVEPVDRAASAGSRKARATVDSGGTELKTNAGGECEPTVGVEVGTVDGGFYVADDGPGIPADERSKVFEHGYTSSDDGTGLGLVIVEGIVEAHDWTIEVTESVDGGARFDVTDVSSAEK